MAVERIHFSCLNEEVIRIYLFLSSLFTVLSGWGYLVTKRAEPAVAIQHLEEKSTHDKIPSRTGEVVSQDFTLPK